MSESLEKMILHAKKLHENQIRRYTGEKYEIHLAEVAANTMMYYHLVVEDVPLHVYLSTAWMHDSVEDQGQQFGQLVKTAESFGFEVSDAYKFAHGVLDLSDTETGNRSERLLASRRRLYYVPLWVQLIKCCDLSSNTRSIFQKDPSFFPTYAEEKKLVLKVLSKVPEYIKENLNEELDDLLLKHTQRSECIDPDCTGILVEDTRSVAYRTDRGELKTQNDVHGLFCTNCNFIQVKDSRGSDELLNRFAKRKAFFGLNLKE